VRLFRGLFLAKRPDVLGLLRRQAAITVSGFQAFAEWSETGADELSRRVRDAEHEADDVRRELLVALGTALTTPVEQEDLYALSERLDTVLNTAKNIVREADALGIRPDEHTAVMGRLAADAVAQLADALGELGRKHERAGEHADAAIKSSRGIERCYREALASLSADLDAKSVVFAHELYGGYTVVADSIVRVATRTRYALLKDA
jgi:uncharacterized protein Yka (UPF0111/DUF47 family)